MTQVYVRQTIIESWDQEKLERTRVCLVGEGLLSDILLVDLLALGVKRIHRIGKTDFFPFGKIAPDAELEQIPVQIMYPGLAEIYLPPSDFIIEASADPYQKFYVIEYANNNDIPYISAAAAENCFLFHSDKHAAASAEESAAFHAAAYIGRPQGIINSLVCAAMTADEFRKYLFHLNYDIVQASCYNDEIDESSFSLEGGKFAMIGAGGSGTFAGLAMAMKGANVTVYDFDSVEPSNLNRQIFFYDSIGKNKAGILAGRL